jgi:uncharacterized BrkB/YihY/UPF0761 family membrane protein
VTAFANFKSAVGQLTVFLVLMAYAYVSSLVLLVGIEIDELLREDASSGETRHPRRALRARPLSLLVTVCYEV